MAPTWLTRLAEQAGVSGLAEQAGVSGADDPITLTPDEIAGPAHPAAEDWEIQVPGGPDAIAKEAEARRRAIAEARKAQADAWLAEQEAANKMRGWPKPSQDAYGGATLVVTPLGSAAAFTQAGIDSGQASDTLASLQMRSNILQKLLGISPSVGATPAETAALKQIEEGRRSIGEGFMRREIGSYRDHTLSDQQRLQLEQLDQQESALQASMLKRQIGAGMRNYLSRLLGL